MNYTIRKSKIEDMNEVMDAHQRSIRELCTQDYNQDQIDKWSDISYCPEIWSKTVNDEYHLVVEVDDKIEGFCHAKIRENGEGEIAGLYFTKEIEGKGIGREVFEKVIDYIKSNKSSKVLITGTITAKGFYERMGFVEIESKELCIRGAVLACFKMEKNLI